MKSVMMVQGPADGDLIACTSDDGGGLCCLQASSIYVEALCTLKRKREIS